MTAEPNLASDIVGLTRTAPLSRRGFMTASAAAAAGYTLAAGPVRADVVKTDTDGLDAGDARIRVSDGEMPGYFARPKGAANPPVVLVAMEVFGLHEYIKDVTRRLAKLGAFAVAPDYYFRKGDLTKITDIPQLLPIVNSKPDVELLADLDSTVAWAKSQGGDTGRLGIIGFCRGGRTVWEYAAHLSALKAGVAFYGPPVDPPNPLWPKSPTQLAPDMNAPVLGLYGEADAGIPVAQVEAMKAALAEARKPAEFKIYPVRRMASMPTIELPQGSRRRCVESNAGLVQEIQSAGLIAPAFNVRRAATSRARQDPGAAYPKRSLL